MSQTLSECDQKFLIVEEVRHSINSVQTDLFNYFPFPKSEAKSVSQRGPEAHLSIEKAMKFLLHRKAVKTGRSHGLESLLNLMNEADKEYLERAFREAVEFYLINPTDNGMGHTESLAKYLDKTGSEKFFTLMRYWHIENPTEDKMNKIIKLIPAIHSELLYAMLELLMPIHAPLRTVNDRVEDQIIRTTTESQDASRLPYDGTLDCAASECIRWVRRYGTRKEAMTDAIKQRFQVSGYPEINDLFENSYHTLKHLNDPAVRFFIAQADGH